MNGAGFLPRTGATPARLATARRRCVLAIAHAVRPGLSGDLRPLRLVQARRRAAAAAGSFTLATIVASSQAGFGRFILNSLVICVAATLVSTFAVDLAAYVFSRFDVPLQAQRCSSASCSARCFRGSC